MTASGTDPRRVEEYRIPAASLQVGDLVNLAPGEDDWQQVLAVHTSGADVPDPATATFVDSLDGNYIYVEFTDLASVDETIYVDADGTGRINGSSGLDVALSGHLNDPGAVRIYLFTKFELVTTRFI